MNCEIFAHHASEYLDGQLKPEQRQLLSEHWEQCTYCQDHLEELRSVSLLVGRLPQPAAPPALPLEIMAAMEQQETVPWNVATMFSHKIAPFRPRPMAQIIGFAFSIIFFSLILSQFIYLPFWYQSPLTYSPVYVAHSDLERLNPSAEYEIHGAGPFTLPRFTDITQIGAMTERVRLDSSVEGIVFLAQVTREGKVSLVELLIPKNDPAMEADLAAALRRVSFEPARDGEYPIPTQTVLMLYWVDIKG